VNKTRQKRPCYFGLKVQNEKGEAEDTRMLGKQSDSALSLCERGVTVSERGEQAAEHGGQAVTVSERGVSDSERERSE
jgi:hypothetical protein